MAIAWLQNKPASWSVADFGCGDAKLAAQVVQKVHSFDLVAANERVVACNMANVPLGTCLLLLAGMAANAVQPANAVQQGTPAWMWLCSAWH